MRDNNRLVLPQATTFANADIPPTATTRSDRRLTKSSGMQTRSSSSRRSETDPNWVPPPWNPSALPDRAGVRRTRSQRGQRSPSPQPEGRRPTTERAPRPRRQPDPNSRRILAIAVPQAVTGVVALLISVVGLVISLPSMPLAIFAILAVQVAGYLLTRQEAPLGMRTAWIIGIIESAVIL